MRTSSSTASLRPDPSADALPLRERALLIGALAAVALIAWAYLAHHRWLSGAGLIAAAGVLLLA